MNVSMLVNSVKYLIYHDQLQLSGWMTDLFIDRNYTDNKLIKAMSTNRIDIVDATVHFIDKQLRDNVQSNIVSCLFKNNVIIRGSPLTQFLTFKIALAQTRLIKLVQDVADELYILKLIEWCMNYGLLESLKLLLDRYDGPIKEIEE